MAARNARAEGLGLRGQSLNQPLVNHRRFNSVNHQGAAARSVLVTARPLHGTIRAPATSLMVVRFGSFRSDADGGDGARPGGVASAAGAPLGRPSSCRSRLGRGDRTGAVAGNGADGERRPPAALAPGQPCSSAPFSTAGAGNAVGESGPAAWVVYGAVANRRNANLRQSERVGRRQHRLRLDEHAEAQEKAARRPAQHDVYAGPELWRPRSSAAASGNKTAAARGLSEKCGAAPGRCHSAAP